MSTDSSAEPFGRYLLHRRVAEGGMAEVFLAEQPSTAGVTRFLAIKRMLPYMSQQKQFVDMFLDEARLTARLTHPNIAQIYDFGEVDGRYFIAMEFIIGETLASVVTACAKNRRYIPTGVVVTAIAQVCDALAHAHALRKDGVLLNVVHRDISPSNIIVTHQGSVKLFDFGIAEAADRQQEPTTSGVLKGKVAYCSPEQLMGQDLDGRSDIFAVGVVLWEMLTARRLFRRDTEITSANAVMSDPAPLLRTIRPDLPEALEVIVAKALAKNRDDRYANATEMRKDLAAVATGPAQRIDEFMASLFGEERVQEALEFKNLKLPVTPELLESVRPRPSRPDGSFRSDTSKPNLPAVPLDALATPGGGTGPLSTPISEDRRTAVVPAPTVAAAEPPFSVDVLLDAPNTAKQALVGIAPPMNTTTRPFRLKSRGGAVAVVLVVGMVAAIAVTLNSPAQTATVTPPPVLAPPVKPVGALRIESVPPGASLIVANQPITEVTPTVIKGLSPGDVRVVAALPGYDSASQVVPVEVGVERSVVLQLRRLPALFSVEGPPGTVLSIDGKPASLGVTEVEPGVRQVRLEVGGKTTFNKGVEAIPGKTITIENPGSPPTPAKPTLPPGALTVGCTPWCRIELDGKDLGDMGLKNHPVPAGTHTLLLEYNSNRVKQPITIKPGELLTIEQAMK